MMNYFYAFTVDMFKLCVLTLLKYNRIIALASNILKIGVLVW